MSHPRILRPQSSRTSLLDARSHALMKTCPQYQRPYPCALLRCTNGWNGTVQEDARAPAAPARHGGPFSLYDGSGFRRLPPCRAPPSVPASQSRGAQAHNSVPQKSNADALFTSSIPVPCLSERAGERRLANNRERQRCFGRTRCDWVGPPFLWWLRQSLKTK